MTKPRQNVENDLTITFDWLEKELFETTEIYIVIHGFYGTWDKQKDQKSPQLEEILNFLLYRFSYELVSIQPMGNSHCKEMVFKRI